MYGFAFWASHVIYTLISKQVVRITCSFKGNVSFRGEANEGGIQECGVQSGNRCKGLPTQQLSINTTTFIYKN